MDDKNYPPKPQESDEPQPSTEPAQQPPQVSDQPFDQSSSAAVDPYEPMESTGPVVQPTEQTTQPMTEPISQQPQPKNKRKLIIIISAIVLLVLVVLALVYNFWYQNPNKVVADGIMNAIQAKTISYTGNVTTTGDAKVKINFNGANAMDSGKLSADVTFDFQNESYTLAADALIDSKDDLYFKVRNIDALVENYRSMVPPESQALFDQIIAKVEDKWVKVSAEDLRNFSPDAAQAQRCMTDAANKLQQDTQVKNQLVELYKKHPFISIDEQLGSKDGSLGYRLSPNEEQSTAFTKGLRETDIYKSLQECDPTFTITDEDLTDASSPDDNQPVELWVDRWSHTITKVAITDEEDGTNVDAVFEPTFNEEVSIETPKDSTTLQQLQEDVQALIQSAAVTTAP